MKEFMLETSREAYLEYFQGNKNKFLIQRLAIAGLLFVLGVGITLATQNPFVAILAIVLGFIGFKLPYLYLIILKANSDLIKTFIFPQFLQYFLALYSTQGNVYQTLKEVATFIDEPIKSKLEELVRRIDEEGNTYDKYTDFADFIGTPDAYLIMSMLYTFSEEGAVEEELAELENSSQQLSENKMVEMKRHKSYKQMKHINSAIYLVGAWILTFVLIVVGVSFVGIMSQMSTAM